MNTQEGWVASAFVDIANHLVEDFDVVDLLSTLAERSAEFVGATEVGFLLADSNGNLQVVGASSERMEALELFELQNSEGPCLECQSTGEAVVNQRVDQLGKRWPTLAPLLQAAGFRMVHAVPMRLRSRTVGAMNLFHTEERQLDPNELQVTQAFADAATIAILQDRALREATRLAEQLQHALEARIVVEQAKGVLSERLQVEMDKAFVLLRTYARANNRRLSDVSLDLTNRRLEAEEIAAASR